MKKIILVISSLFLFCTSFSQSLFEKIYRVTGKINLNGFAPSSNGGYFVLAKDWDLNENFIFKIDTNGNILWSRRYYDPLAIISISKIVPSSNGGFVAAGNYRLSTQFHTDYFLLKGDSMGNISWAKIYDYDNYDNVDAMTVTPNDGILISSFPTTQGLPTLLQVDSTGNVMMYRELIGQTGNARIYGIEMATDSNYLAMIFSAGVRPYFRSLKITPTGNVLWALAVGDSLNGATIFAGYSLLATADSGCIASGELSSGFVTYPTLAICKITAQGNVDWLRMNPPHSIQLQTGYKIISTHDHGYAIATGYNNNDTNSITQTYLTKTDSMGHFLWTKKYHGIIYFDLNIVETPDYGFTYAANTFYPSGTYNPNVLVLNTDSMGNALCSDSAISMADSTVTLPSFSMNYSTSTLPILQTSLSLSIDSGISAFDYCDYLSNIGSNLIYGVKLFPNPFHTTATLEIKNEELRMKRCELKIYNTFGALVLQSSFSNLQSIIISREHLSDGLYYYELRTDNYELIGKGKFVVD